MDRLLSHLDGIDARRRALLDLAASLDARDLTRRPGGDAWSVLEVVEHLVLAERAVLGDLEDPGVRREAPRSLRGRVLHRVVLSILRFGIPVRVPAPSMVPVGGRSLEELRAEWDQSFARMRRYVSELDPAAAGRAVFHHPVSGPLTTAQALELMDAHLLTHERQVRRILAAHRTPAAVDR